MQTGMRYKPSMSAGDTQIGAFVLGMHATGLTAARCLGREGISVKGFDVGAKRAGFRSRYCSAEVCPDPLDQPDALVRFLRHQVRHGSQKVVLFPTSDAFFLFLSRHRVQLADRFLMNLPAVDVAESVVNKRRLYELAAANDTAFPQSYFPATYDEALGIKDSLRYPAFIKPYWGHQWRRTSGDSTRASKCSRPRSSWGGFERSWRRVIQPWSSPISRAPTTTCSAFPCMSARKVKCWRPFREGRFVNIRPIPERSPWRSVSATLNLSLMGHAFANRLAIEAL